MEISYTNDKTSNEIITIKNRASTLCDHLNYALKKDKDHFKNIDIIRYNPDTQRYTLISCDYPRDKSKFLPIDNRSLLNNLFTFKPC